MLLMMMMMVWDGWGMVWDGMGWYGMVWDGMGWLGDGMGWYGMVWDGMGWYGMVWERELAAGGWWNGGEPEEEVASGVVGVWEEVLGELGLVGGGAVSSGRSWWALGDA